MAGNNRLAGGREGSSSGTGNNDGQGENTNDVLHDSDSSKLDLWTEAMPFVTTDSNLKVVGNTSEIASIYKSFFGMIT